MKCLTFLLVLCMAIMHHRVESYTQMYSQTLDDNYQLQWYHDDATITFHITAHTEGWVGLGFSPTGTMASADILIAGVRHGKEYIFDCYAWKNGPPTVDKSQDAHIIYYRQDDDKTTIVLKRKLVTGDGHDTRIKEGKMNIIWAYGKWDVGGQPSWSNYHFWNRGLKKIELLPEMDREDYEYQSKDALGNGMSVFWYHSLEHIYFQIKAATDGWVGLGFSPSGTMAGADMMISGFKDGKCYVHDTYARRNGPPEVDDSQDVHIQRCSQKDGKTEVLLKREVSTGDSEDMAIQPGDMHVIWAYGKWDLSGKPGWTNYHLWNRGARTIDFVPIDEANSTYLYIQPDDDEEAANVTLPILSWMIDLDVDVFLYWEMNETMITFKMTAPTTGWMGLGFSPEGTMAGADLMIVGEADGKAYAVDAHAEKNGVPDIDESQDCDAIASVETSRETTVVFSRMLDTGDSDDDWPITDSKMYVIWSYGGVDVTNPPTIDLYHGGNRGVMELNFYSDGNYMTGGDPAPSADM